MKTGFENDHVPVHTVPDVVHEGSMPVNVPTSKCVGGKSSIRAAKPLSEDAIIFWETDPRIELISHYPVELKWSSPSRVTTDRIEFGIQWRGGRRTYIDVVKASWQDQRWFERRYDRLKRQVRRQLDAEYSVISEKVLHGAPRLYNRRHIYSYLHVIDDRAKARVRRVMRESEPPMSIAAMTEAAKLRSIGYRMLDPTGSPFTQPLPEIDRAYTAIMQLAAAGELRIDPRVEITNQSLVTWYERSF